MKALLLLTPLLAVLSLHGETKPLFQLKGPDAVLSVELRLSPAGEPRYTVERAGKTILQESKLGLLRGDADFSRALTLQSLSAEDSITDDYELRNSKRLTHHYEARRRIAHFTNAAGARVDLVFQVSRDGVAFRYVFPDKDAATHQIKEEFSSFRFAEGARAWLQPMSKAKTGWKRTNPSYEEYYEMDIPVGTSSPTGAGWVFPALFRAGDNWVLLSETALGRGFCGARLRHESPNGEYSIGYPPAEETRDGLSVLPESTLPWSTPWRIIVAGPLKTLIESTLGTDLADKPAALPAVAVEPGKASWSWPLLGDPSTEYQTQKRFIDYAADMGWRYTLIDALWDTQIGDEKIAELSAYARSKGVSLLLWYNSAGSWNEAPQTPRDRLLTAESRRKEFERMKALGIAGLKIDFFGGDGRPMIDYYHSLLEETAPYGLAINFHGATLPRGWQRSYPHLMTMESVRGLEFITFEQTNADRAPSHMAMLPFARNLFDPMDFTPVVLDKIGRVERRTSSAFELALAVLFTSGIQHYAEIPEGMAKAPAGVRELLKRIPSVWEDLRYISGKPGEHIVLARKGAGRWYVAGINAGNEPLVVRINLNSIPVKGEGTVWSDGNELPLGFSTRVLKADAQGMTELVVKPRGGFLAEFPSCAP